MLISVLTKGNLIVIDDQMIEAGKDNRIVNLFTKRSHHRNLSVIYIMQNLFHQGKGNRSISLNSHYLVLFKNPRDKLQILTLAKQIYPSETAWFIKSTKRRCEDHLGIFLKRIEFPKLCSGASNNKLWWCPRNAFRIIWIISYFVQTLGRTKKRSSTCSCKTIFESINTSSNL